MNVQIETGLLRFEEMGLSFMEANLESFLADQARQDACLLDMVSALIETEYIPCKERAIKSRLKLSAIPVKKRLEDFDLGWLKGGLTTAKFAELKSLAFIERKENVLLLGPSGLGKTYLSRRLPTKHVLSDTPRISCRRLASWRLSCMPVRKVSSSANSCGSRNPMYSSSMRSATKTIRPNRPISFFRLSMQGMYTDRSSSRPTSPLANGRK